MRPRGGALAVMLALSLAAACDRPAHVSETELAETLQGPPRSVQHAMSVPGRHGATPAVAAAGRHVVLVWSASDGVATDLFAAVSEDSGQTFSAPRRVNDRSGDVLVTDDRPPRVAMGRIGDALRVFVAWTSALDGETVVRLAASADGGARFEPAVTLRHAGARGAPGWLSVVASPEGVPFLLWADNQGAERAPAARAASWPPHQRPAAGGGSTLVAVRWDEDRPAAASPLAADACPCCSTALAVEPGGTLYAAWRQLYPGRTQSITVARSDDGGRTFEPAVPVGEERRAFAGCPDTGGPTMVVDPTGLMHVVWQAVGLDDTGEPQLFLVWSRDARTFTQPAHVSVTDGKGPSHPSMVLVGTSDLALVWDEGHEGRQRVVLRVTEAGMCGRVRDPFGLPLVVSGSASARYPVVASANDGVLVAWTEGPVESPSVAVRLLPWPEIERW